MMGGQLVSQPEAEPTEGLGRRRARVRRADAQPGPADKRSCPSSHVSDGCDEAASGARPGLADGPHPPVRLLPQDHRCQPNSKPDHQAEGQIDGPVRGDRRAGQDAGFTNFSVTDGCTAP